MELTMKNDEMQNDNSKTKIHFFYVCFILISVIVLLIAYKWTAQPNFTEYLSNAATSTSLVLAVLAIIYSYIQNDSLSKTTGMVSEAANETRNATLEISSLIDSVKSINKSSQEREDLITNSVSSFKHQALLLDETALKIKEIYEVTSKIPQDFKNLKDHFQNSRVGNINNNALISEDISNKMGTEFVNRASPAGHLLLYACYLSHINKKSFKLIDISEKIIANDYLYGFFIGIMSTGVILYNSINAVQAVPGTEIIIEKCPDVLSECEGKVNDWINTQSPEIKDKWNTTLTYINEHFKKV
jgi:hypothetical protein